MTIFQDSSAGECPFLLIIKTEKKVKKSNIFLDRRGKKWYVFPRLTKKWQIVPIILGKLRCMPVMFYGEYRHTVDEKSRLSIPAKFRALLGGDGSTQFFLTRGFDPCILICTREKWEELQATYAKHPLTSKAARNFKRAFYTGACEVIFDKQGRIAIPENLLTYSGIKRDVVIAGVSDTVEVWDAGLYEKSLSDILSDFGKAAEEFGKDNTER
jgi:MraZ protein